MRPGLVVLRCGSLASPGYAFVDDVVVVLVAAVGAAVAVDAVAAAAVA